MISFQGGHYTFAMERAPIETDIIFDGYKDVRAGIVKWPMSVIRLTAKAPERLVEVADRILLSWRGYTDEKAMVELAETDGEPHNTITPIARRRGEDFELDLVLREQSDYTGASIRSVSSTCRASSYQKREYWSD